LLEHPGLYERLTAEDNLVFYSRIWHLSKQETRSRIRDLLTHLDLWDRRKEIAGTWSRGMKQKLAFARTLLHRPKLVFLDEPTAGLDPIAAASLREDLAAMADREGVTIFLTTHNLAEAEKLCHVIGVIRQGKLLAIGSPEALRHQGGSPRVQVAGTGFSPALLEQLRSQPGISEVHVETTGLCLTLKDNLSIAPFVNLMVAAGVQIEGVTRMNASPEEVFLTLMEEEK
jgi:ABC-2 type transport system ATP-binding protein